MKRSFTIMVTGLMVVLLMALFSAAASGAGNVSVAVVNIDKVINESLAGQGANRVLLQLIKEKQDELNKAEAQRMRNELVGEIQEIILAIGEEQKYSLIIDSTTITYYTRTNIIDITGEVVRRYNEKRNSW